MPETLLYIYENTNIQNIVGLDYSYEAICTAGQMLNALGLKNITLAYSDGKDYDFKGADIVYIAIFVENKHKILEQIAKTAKDDVQIVVRSATHLTKIIYDDMSENLFHRLQITSKVVSNSPFITRETLVIEKHKL